MNMRNIKLVDALAKLGGTIANAMDADPDFTPCMRPASIVMDNVTALALKISEGELSERIEQVRELAEHVEEHHGAAPAPEIDATKLSATQLALCENMIDLAGVAYPALKKGNTDPTVNAYFYRSLAALAHSDSAATEWIEKYIETKAIAQKLLAR